MIFSKKTGTNERKLAAASFFDVISTSTAHSLCAFVKNIMKIASKIRNSPLNSNAVYRFTVVDPPPSGARLCCAVVDPPSTNLIYVRVCVYMRVCVIVR